MASKNTETSLVKAVGATGILLPEDVGELSRLFAEGFEQDKTILLGDPKDNKVPVFFGELLGDAGPVMVTTPGGVPDPKTGEVPMSQLETYIFNPLHWETFTPFRQATYTVICSYAPARQCRKLLALAKAKSEETGKVIRAHMLMRYDGTVKTRKGNQLNDFSFLHKFVAVGEAPAGPGGFVKTEGAPAGAT